MEIEKMKEHLVQAKKVTNIYSKFNVLKWTGGIGLSLGSLVATVFAVNNEEIINPASLAWFGVGLATYAAGRIGENMVRRQKEKALESLVNVDSSYDVEELSDRIDKEYGLSTSDDREKLAHLCYISKLQTHLDGAVSTAKNLSDLIYEKTSPYITYARETAVLGLASTAIAAAGLGNEALFGATAISTLVIGAADRFIREAISLRDEIDYLTALTVYSEIPSEKDTDISMLLNTP